MRPILWITFLFCSWTTHADQPVQADQWKHLFERDGITVSTNPSRGQSVLAVRSQGIVEAPLAKVASVVFDCTRATEWSDDLKESRIQRWFTPTEFLEYDHVGSPFFLFRDRDFVTHGKIARDEPGYEMTLTYSSVQDGALPERSGLVRGEMIYALNGLRSVRGGSATDLTIEVQADPRGHIPTFIVNWAQKTFAVDYFEGLRKQAAKADVTVAPEIATALATPLRLR